MKTAIIDIDGTLADCRHRLHHVLPGGKRDWNAFFAGISDDTVIAPVREVTRALAYENKVVLCSGRPEDYRAQTEAWLDENGIPYDALYMRPAGDTRADHIIKLQLLQGIRDDGYDPFVVIDDRQSVVDMWRDQGLVCLQAAPSELPIPATARLVLMVGPCGAGKSSWLAMNANPSHVISSDQLRMDLCGDLRDQTKNQDVFEAMHALAKTRLKHGLPTVLDATHLRRKDRMTAAQLVPAYCAVTYIVIDRPMSEKRRDGGWRNEVPGLLEKHTATFQAQLKDILAGDNLANVTVVDQRRELETVVVRRAA